MSDTPVEARATIIRRLGARYLGGVSHGDWSLAVAAVAHEDKAMRQMMLVQPLDTCECPGGVRHEVDEVEDMTRRWW